MKQHKRGLFLFLCSCIPGCGQMYQGYMKRGSSLMLVFWGWLTVVFFFGLDILLFMLFPIWLYTYFDSYNLRTHLENGTAGEDEFLFGLSDVDSEKINALCRERHSLLGWILVALGLYMLYERIIQRLASFLWQFEYLNWLYELLVYDVPRLVVTFGIIALGVWFIRGPRKADSAEEIPVFVPPVSAPLTEEPPAVEKEEAEHGDE
ncbi:MAG: hypothetical protein IIW96_00615 [Oscillibacter sp.]|nr:hypothetical protein [Oscillibacter sp.]